MCSSPRTSNINLFIDKFIIVNRKCAFWLQANLIVKLCFGVLTVRMNFMLFGNVQNRSNFTKIVFEINVYWLT